MQRLRLDSGRRRRTSREARCAVGKAEGFRRFLMRCSPSQQRKLTAYKEQAQTAREVAALFSTHVPPRRRNRAPQLSRVPSAAPDFQPETAPVLTVSASPDAPDFDESLEAVLARRYGSTTADSWYWA